MANGTEQQKRFLAHVSQEARDELRQFLPGGNAMQLVGDYLQQKSEEWKNEPLNVGIIGNSGAGKSSFINATRDLTADDEGAAQLNLNDKIQSDQIFSTSFEHPSNHELKYWELPGVGTPDYPRNGYLERVGFEKYDFFVIITRQRFTENDLLIAKEITRMKKKFFFVRTCVDTDIDGDRRAHPKTHNKEAVLEMIRRDIKDNLGELYPEDGVFLVDNYNKIAFDFHRLQRRIIESLPSLKREAFIFRVEQLSKEVIEAKVKAFKRRIWMLTLLSGTTGAIPLPGLSVAVDFAIVLHESKFYFRELGLDDKSLQSLARSMKCDASPLFHMVAAYKTKSFFSIGIFQLLQIFSVFAASKLAKERLHFVPIMGYLTTGAISFGTVFLLLRRMSSKIKDVALKAIKTAAENSSS